MRKRFVLAGVVVAGLGAAAVFTPPAIKAWACPACYGLTSLGDGIYLDPVASADDQRRLTDVIATAQVFVGKTFALEPALELPDILICLTPECHENIDGSGRLAVVYGNTFVYVSPDGANETIITHEFSHLAVSQILGTFNLVKGVVPMWFNEGLAVIVANDARFLPAPLGSAAECADAPRDLPIGAREWARAIPERGIDLYAWSACAVSEWMDRNGGQAGVNAALTKSAETGEFPL